MLCKITFVSASSWLLNTGWESQDLLVIWKHSLSLDKNIISVASFTKAAERFFELVECIEKLAELVEFSSHCLIIIFWHPLVFCF